MLSDGQVKTFRLVSRAVESEGAQGRLEPMALESGCCSRSGRIMLAQPQPGPISLLEVRVVDRLIAGREGAMAIGVIGQGQADLLEVVRARGPPRLLAGGLDRGQQEGDQDRDDGDDDQELDQGEAEGASPGPSSQPDVDHRFGPEKESS